MADEPGFDWDEANRQHLARHEVAPEEFEESMRDANLFHYENVDGEDRWTAVGTTNSLRVLVMVFTIREGRVRAVTAYNASQNLARDFWRHKGT